MIKLAFIKYYLNIRENMELNTLSRDTSTDTLVTVQERKIAAWVSEILEMIKKCYQI